MKNSTFSKYKTIYWTIQAMRHLLFNMKNSSQSSSRVLNIVPVCQKWILAHPIFSILLCMVLHSVAGHTQINFKGTYSTSDLSYECRGLPGGICEDVTTYYGYKLCGEGTFGVGDQECAWQSDYGAQVQGVLANIDTWNGVDPVDPFVPFSRVNKAQAGVDYHLQFKVSVNTPSVISLELIGGTQLPLYLTLDGGVSFDSNQPFLHLDSTYSHGIVSKDYFFSTTVNFSRGTMQGALVFPITQLRNGTPHWWHSIVVPIFVGGPDYLPGEEVEILGTTLDPQIPYMILHDPPGDGSISTFEDNKVTCRERETSYVQDASNSFYASAKLGIKGSVGLIVDLDFEAYIQFSGSGNIGNLGIQATTNQVCVTTGQGFSTSNLPGAEDGGDVFIGFGRELYYGAYNVVDFKNCLPYIAKRLIYAPVEGSERQFVYTKDAILDNIANLQTIAVDTFQNDRHRNEAQNQIDVWNQVLQLNEDNKNNPNNDTLDLKSYSAGNTQTHSSSIEIMNTSSITTEHYVEGTFGIDGLIEFGGSGIGFGWEYATSERFGATQNQSQSSSRMLSYTLTDDDPGDVFDVDIVRDPMFGTPVFRLKDDGITKSSCPYEGGYQRDNPKLSIVGEPTDHITLENVPGGSTTSFTVKLCNESNEKRGYYLKLNASSNLKGAVVKAGGVPLNGNELGQLYDTISPGTCLDISILVKQNEVDSMRYPDLQIYAYPKCEPGLASSIYASVYFGTTSGIEENSPVKQLSVFPNPTSGEVNVAFTMKQPADIHFELFDMVGNRSLLTAEENYAAGEQHKTFNVDALPSGIYQLAIRTDQSVISKKVIVQH
ncbi:MAG: T9SS type A sorting domain-containing protein [Saprospiraceae bacterium]|uniref:T9SS type A sorting domain-containing protein n=1 Tax=Candidatus Opimibacter skivensis TaxID=2982028 RepID=A0A9D7STC0_9BACT|nr:T9SS type A sorting domain-containing protein [Candidatus Opimibacter skivensis]